MRDQVPPTSVNEAPPKAATTNGIESLPTTTWAARVAAVTLTPPTTSLPKPTLPPLYDNSIPPRGYIDTEGVLLVTFSKEEVTRMASPFAYTLIGRFTTKRPLIDDITRVYTAPGNFLGSVVIGARNHRSVFIRFELEDDFRRAWSRTTWTIKDSTMHTFRWVAEQSGNSRDISPHSVSVWIGFPGLRPHLFTPAALESLASMVGTFIRADKDVQLFSHPGYARVCVEIDLLAPLHRMILIWNGDELIRQTMVYENLPRFCTHCIVLGHTLHTCRQKATQTTPTEEEYLSPLAYNDYIAATISDTQGRRAKPPLSSRPVVTSVQPTIAPPPPPRPSGPTNPRVAKPSPATSQWLRKGAEKRPKSPPRTRVPSSRKGKEVSEDMRTSNSFALLMVQDAPEASVTSSPTRSTTPPRSPAPLPTPSSATPIASLSSPSPRPSYTPTPNPSSSSHLAPASIPTPPTSSPAPIPTTPPAPAPAPSPPTLAPPIPTTPPAPAPAPSLTPLHPPRPSPAPTPPLHPSHIPSEQVERLTNCQAPSTSSEGSASSTSGRDSTSAEDDISLSEDSDVDTPPGSRRRSHASPPTFTPHVLHPISGVSREPIDL
ncbi:uncharacterized protein LOC144704376 [Wolffia australiana]